MRLANVGTRQVGRGVWLLLAIASYLTMTSCKWSPIVSQVEVPRLDPGWPKQNMRWQETNRPPINIDHPVIPGAEFVREDQLCAVCHKAHGETFAQNVHRNQGCESCHGPASQHLESRGRQPGSILSFPKMNRAQRSEVCLKCHEESNCAPGAEWRASAHAHAGVSCTDCHSGHYNLPPGTPTNTVDQLASADMPEGEWRVLLANALSEPERAPELPSLRGTSHNLGAVTPQVCYRCHQEHQALEVIAHPHQVNGKNGFDCTTCHNPHGNVIAYSRRELCLECHKGTPTAAWHSSIHDQVGVACTDCHNPHPSPHVQRLVNTDHTSLQRDPRLPMSVNEQQACAKCHPKIFGLMQLPSHHPIKEGKMSCSDCHDPHGQADDHLRAETVNLTCYKCHADKQGPFVYEHPPVNEDCSICHNPHGAVANNLLHQPPTFLCLRCHTGHRSPPSDHFGIGTSDIDSFSWQRPVLYTNCTQCHSQVHGSDHPSQNRAGVLFR